MDLRITVEPQQGATYDQLLQVARQTRQAGFSGFFRSDHVLAMDKTDTVGPSDAFVTLGALAVQVPDIRLGTLVTSATFRHPSMVAIAAAGIDQMSAGRLDLGLGSGWFAAEHQAYGLDFGSSFGERFSRLEEQLAVLTGLWAADEPFSFAGRFYRLDGAPGLPKPVQRDAVGRPAVPLIIGGHGPTRTPRLAARYASDFNCGFRGLDEVTAGFERVRRACEAIDRDPASLVYSSAQVMCVGRDDAEFARRAAHLQQDPAELVRTGIAGTVEQVIDKLGRWSEAGVQRMYLQTLDLDDLDQVALVGAEVLPAVR